MTENKSLVERFLNCQGCWTESTCQVEFTYNDNGRIVDAKVYALEADWEYRPHGDRGGQAPFCPRCLAKT